MQARVPHQHSYVMEPNPLPFSPDELLVHFTLASNRSQIKELEEAV